MALHCEHNQTMLQEARTDKPGVRIIPRWLPIKSPWLNRIEPKWKVASPFA